MNLLIPLDSNQKISLVNDAKGWMCVVLENGDKTGEKLYRNKNDINEAVDFVIVKDKDEDIDDFLDEGIGVLIAPFQEEIDDIVEAFIFRELYELGN